MKNYPSLLVLAGLLFAAYACVPAKMAPTPMGPTVTYNPFATLFPTPFLPLEASTPMPAISRSPEPYHASGDPETGASGRTRYVLNAMLDYSRHTLTVAEEIFFPNNSGETLEYLVLAVEANHWADCFQLDSLSRDGYPVAHSLRGHELRIDLAPPLEPGQTIPLSLRYRLLLPASNSLHVFGYKSDQINLVDWYPFIVPYRDGWVLHEAGAVGEHLVYDAADFEVTFTVHPPMTVAASAPLVDGMYRLQSGRTFVLSVSPFFQVTASYAGSVPVISYHLPEEETAARAALAESNHALILFSDLFGEYPYPSLSIVETDFSDGMEYDGLIFLGRTFYVHYDATKLNYLIDLAIHETAHQWWYGKVGNDQAMEPWLDEALCTYSEYLFYERNYPGVAASWWTFREGGTSAVKPVDANIYASDTWDEYRSHSYLMGARFLHELRTGTGDALFFYFLESYASQMSGKIASSDDFFTILDEITELELAPLLLEYFDRLP